MLTRLLQLITLVILLTLIMLVINAPIPLEPERKFWCMILIGAIGVVGCFSIFLGDVLSERKT